jgi:hypothetical protein
LEKIQITSPAGIRASDRPARGEVTIPTELSRFLAKRERIEFGFSLKHKCVSSLAVPGTVSDTYIKRTLDERPTRAISMNEHGEDIRFVPGNIVFFLIMVFPTS